MPTHITNIIEASKEVIEFMLDDNGVVDFKLVIPAPDGFDIGGKVIFSAERAAKRYVNGAKDFAIPSRPLLDINDPFIVMLRNKKKYGFYHGMDFALANWGTEWNAYSQEIEDETCISFNTAWYHPKPVIATLSKKFPQETIKVEFASEDIGSNCGFYIIKNGDVTNEHIVKNQQGMSEEEVVKWNKFAFEITHKGEDPKEFGYGSDWLRSEEG